MFTLGLYSAAPISCEEITRDERFRGWPADWRRAFRRRTLLLLRFRNGPRGGDGSAHDDGEEDGQPVAGRPHREGQFAGPPDSAERGQLCGRRETLSGSMRGMP